LPAIAPGRAANVAAVSAVGLVGRLSCRRSASSRRRRARRRNRAGGRPGEHACAALPQVAAMDEATGGARHAINIC
jgi:hypothetical protein